MQRYYRTVMDVSLLNEMLLQLFREAILNEGENTIVPLNPRFQIRNDYLEVTGDDTFVRSPSAILELFRLLQENPDLVGVAADEIVRLSLRQRDDRGQGANRGRLHQAGRVR